MVRPGYKKKKIIDSRENGDGYRGLFGVIKDVEVVFHKYRGIFFYYFRIGVQHFQVLVALNVV